MATYKYNGKKVSEREFKEKVYGKDSKQAQAAKRREEKKKADRANAGKKGSSYSKVTRRDGSVEIKDSNQKTVETLTAEQAKKAEAEKNKKTIVVGVGKNKDGSTRVENVGKYLTEEQRREVSRLTSEKGRLTVEEIQKNERINAQGQKVIEQNVRFSYQEQQKQKNSDSVNKKPPAYIQAEAQRTFRDNPLAQKVTIGEWTFTRTGKTEEKEVSAYKGTGGEIQPVEKPKGFFNRLEYEMSLAKEKLISKQEKKFYKQESAFLEGGALFALGVATGVYNTGKSIVRPDQTIKGLATFGVEAVKNPKLLVDTARGIGEEYTRNPAGFIGEALGSAGVFKAVGKVAKVANVKANAPKIVGEGSAQTVRVDLADDVARSTTQQSTLIKAGRNKFKVDAVTKTLDKADDAGARLQSSETALKISKLDKKGTIKTQNTGVARSEVVASKTDSGKLLARGDTVQATNVGDKTVVRQGSLNSVGEVFDDGSRATTVVKTGKGVSKKGNLNDPKALQFTDDASQKVSSVESSASKKVLEFDAPEKQILDTPFGKVTIESKQTFKHTLYDTVMNNRAGKYLTKADKKSDLKIDPYAQTVSEGGVTLAFKQGADDVASAVNKPVKNIFEDKSSSALQVVQDGKSLSFTQTDQGFVLSAKKIVSQTPSVNPSSSQALTAVKDIKKVQVDKTNAVIDQTVNVATGAKVATVRSNTNAKLKPFETVTVKGSTPVSVQKVKQQPKDVVTSKSFSSTKVLPQTKQSSEVVADVKTRSKSKVAVVSKTLTDSIVKTDTVQQTVVKTATIQKPVVSTTQSLSVMQKLQAVAPKLPFAKSKAPQPKQGFDVFVRERGVFKKVSKSALSASDARDLGAYTAFNSPRATFALRPSASPLGSVSSKVRGSFDAFRKNFVRKGGLYIEKKEKRIKSGGEKAGITRKGLLAIKSKKCLRG